VLRRALALLLATSALAGCAAHPPGVGPRAEALAVGAARFRIVYWPEDAAAARQVRRAVEAAAPRVSRWGALRHPVTITIHPSHEALEVAVQRPDHGWLKAWARFDTVDLQSPRTWDREDAGDAKVRELVTHELTHCAMYQVAGDRLSWTHKEIPVWFTEGIANVAAGWGYRYGEIRELYAFYLERLPAAGAGTGAPGRAAAGSPVALPGDPIADPGPLYLEHSEVVYRAAYHAAEFLIRRYGDDRVRRIIELMGEGERFPASFEQAVGITEAEFAADFRRYVVWQGWRR
jgi:hypothetical protein